MTLGLVLMGEAAPGDLDPTFGVGGKVTTDFGGNDDRSFALVLQPDGKLVAAGCFAQGGNCFDFCPVTLCRATTCVQRLRDLRSDPCHLHLYAGCHGVSRRLCGDLQL